jgi:hypothetical protein
VKVDRFIAKTWFFNTNSEKKIGNIILVWNHVWLSCLQFPFKPNILGEAALHTEKKQIICMNHLLAACRVHLCGLMKGPKENIQSKWRMFATDIERKNYQAI